MPVKRIEMALHIQELCATNNITVKYQSLEDETPRYWARPASKIIQIRPTKNTGYYVSALHELGHILGERQMQRNRLLTRELYAWIWAREQALVWTETAERIMRRAMDSYGWTDRQKQIWDRRFQNVM
tara:strand:+ start:298 stop:681 length:384 start_codon:yes stop_codon:yes gene_type:complete